MGDDATVLVVGPDDAVVGFLVARLRRGEIDAHPAASTDAAIRVNRDDPALVVVDHDLEPVRSIRALADPKKASVPIAVFLADGASPEEAETATETGADHVVSRPVTDTVLLERLRAILDAG